MSGRNVPFFRRWLLWLLLGAGCLLISACGGNRVNIYDKARVLDSSQVHESASQVSKNVNVYTFNDFHGRQQDFYPAVVNKLAVNPDTVLLVIDTVHPSLYILRGKSVNLSPSDMAQVKEAFNATYNNGKGSYTQATNSALNSLQDKLNTNHSSPLVPLLWLIPLVLIVGAFFFVFQRTRRRPHYG